MSDASIQREGIKIGVSEKQYSTPERMDHGSVCVSLYIPVIVCMWKIMCVVLCLCVLQGWFIQSLAISVSVSLPRKALDGAIVFITGQDRPTHAHA